MGSRWHREIIARLRRIFSAKREAPNEMASAKQLIAAIDRGGIPLNPVRVNAIARALGLEVSKKATVEETIRRIRDAVARAQPPAS